jgi:hypothetical protein
MALRFQLRNHTTISNNRETMPREDGMQLKRMRS